MKILLKFTYSIIQLLVRHCILKMYNDKMDNLRKTLCNIICILSIVESNLIATSKSFCVFIINKRILHVYILLKLAIMISCVNWFGYNW